MPRRPASSIFTQSDPTASPWVRAAALARAMREPLAGLHGYLQGLEDGVFSPESAYRLLHKELLRLQHLVEDLEALAQSQSGAVT
ncbi:MAG: histidine kinase dimerization/phospho-acceptor domain-containing protein [Anaerolineales bacterium]|nr:histidine kinase dimerization/phospho-acceptor domain-containing protein [Anaerolineales bacterium]